MMIRSSLLSRIALACSSVFYSAQSSGLRHERCSAFIVGALSSASSNASRCPLALRSAAYALCDCAHAQYDAAVWEKGLLIAEAGLTLEEILTLCMPRGWFLPVTPGTQYVTLGGALANDV